MLRNRSTFDGIDWRRLFGISIVFGILFALPIVVPVEVRVIVENVGDVSGPLSGTWSFLTGVATFASLVLAVRSYRHESEEDRPESDSSGPDTAIHIDGVEGDLNLVLGDEERIEGYEPADEDDATTEPESQKTS